MLFRDVVVEPGSLLVDACRCGPFGPSDRSNGGSFGDEAVEDFGPLGQLVVLGVGFEEPELSAGDPQTDRVQPGCLLSDDRYWSVEVDAVCGRVDGEEFLTCEWRRELFRVRRGSEQR